MRNIRIFVEFAAVVMPGALLLLALGALYASHEWIKAGSYNTAGGIASAVAIAFALGHLLQGVAHILVDPLWRLLQQGGPVAWAVRRFSGSDESRRFLTVAQLEQLDVQFPAKLAVPFPKPEDASQRFALDAAVAHIEAFLESVKLADALEDYVTDLKLNRGLFTAFVLVAIAAFPAIRGELWLILPAAALAAIAAFARMDQLNRKYTQALFLLFLTASSAAGGGGRGGGDGAGGAGGGGGMPIPLGRLGGGAGGGRHAMGGVPDDESQ